jgi:chromosomal replication initiation ATPase DnaA
MSARILAGYAPELPLIAALRDRGVHDIVERHAVTHNVTVGDIVGERRSASVVRARHGAWREIRATMGMSYPEIASLFGRDHTTVMSACAKAKRLTPPTPRAILAALRVI